MPDGFSVTIDDLAVTARTLGALHGEVLEVLSTAATGRLATGGMAGDDPVLARWRHEYDSLASLTWSVVGTSGALLADIAGRLVRTGNAYLDADRASGGVASVPLPLPPAVGAVPAAPPSSTGPVGPGVPDPLAPYWPGGEPTLLRDAARAWSALADGLEDAAFAADSAFRSLTAANAGATFSAMAVYWSRHFTDCGTRPLFNAGPIAARRLAHSCTALAEVIDQSRSEVGRAAAEAAADLERIEAPTIVLRRVSRGAAELIHLVGYVALTTKYLNAYRDRYLHDVDRLVGDLQNTDRAHLEHLVSPPTPAPAVDVALDDVGVVVGLGLTGSAWDAVGGRHPTPDAVHLTAADRVHILTGDAEGGGHLSGRGVPGKSEFPPSWDGDRIVATALALARAPDVPPAPGRKHRWVIEGVRDGVRIRVVTEPDGRVITAVPLSGPGVIQNPRRR